MCVCCVYLFCIYIYIYKWVKDVKTSTSKVIYVHRKHIICKKKASIFKVSNTFLEIKKLHLVEIMLFCHSVYHNIYVTIKTCLF